MYEEPNGALLLDVGGVGYEVMVPAGALGRTRAQGDEIELFVHTHVREDALDLFGFGTDSERRVFRLLLTIPNVGPKTAVGILSALSVSDLALAVSAGDLARLAKVPGIGKRTAERLVLELKDKLAGVSAEAGPAGAPPVSSDARGRLLSALTNMGYRAAEAEKAVASLGAKVGEAPLGELLKEALARLS